MKAGKAPAPSGIVVNMIRAAGDMGASMIRDLAATIIRDGKVPSDWEQSFIICFYKGKGDALERGNYRGLKLTEHVMKILERIVDGLNRRFPVWLCPRQRHNRRNICCKADEREVSSCCVYSSCVRSAMLNVSEIWSLTKAKPPTSAAE